MSDRLQVQVDAHVATVRLNRPDKNNAVDLAMFEALIETGEQLAADASVRAVVLHGAGAHFCAGIDLSVFQGEGIKLISGGGMLPREDTPANFFQSAAYVWHALPVPVIAAINGVAFGAGLQIALGADIRYATADAQLSVMELKWGIIPDMAISVTARHALPIDKLKELAYTARVISGTDAEAMGLVTAVKTDPLQAAQELAAEIAARSPQAVRAVKALIDTTWHGDAPECLHREAELQMTLMGTPNQQEAVAANLQKRSPVFADT